MLRPDNSGVPVQLKDRVNNFAIISVMLMSLRTIWIRLLIVWMAALPCGASIVVVARSQNLAGRLGGSFKIWDETFKAQRPHANIRTGDRSAKTASATKETKTQLSALGNGFIGLTVWRLSTAQTHPGSTSAVARSVDAPLRVGDHVKLSIESARSGFLYVIDQDWYSDGLIGKPSLIFPTKRIRGGDNRVEPGLVIGLPDSQDKPPYFTVEKSRPDQSAMALLIILLPKPIPTIATESQRQALSNEQLMAWEQQWGSHVQRFENQADLGRTSSLREEEAAADPLVRLTDQDPGPLTLFRSDSQEGQPILVSMPLKILDRLVSARIPVGKNRE
jgi:hypothetical protein